MRANPVLHLFPLVKFCLIAAVATGLQGQAYAWKRQPAPIVYKGDGYQANKTGQVATPASAPANMDRATQRLNFTYPGSASKSSTPAPSPLSDAPAQRAYASIAEPQALTVSAASDRMLLKFPGTSLSPTAAEPAEQIDPRPVEPAPRAVSQPVSTTALEPLPAPATPAAKPLEQGPAQLIDGTPTPANTYKVSHDPVPMFDESGLAVVFGSEFANMPTANGEILDQSAFMGAHPSLPLPSLVQVTNAVTGQEVIIRVNDRGPYEDGAVLQVTEAAADALGMQANAQNRVSLRYLGAAPAGVELAGAGEALPDSSARVEQPAPSPAPYVALKPQARPTPQARLQTVSYSPPTAQAATAGDTFYVQVGAFSDIANAQDMQFLLQRDFDVVISPARVNGADFFRVRVGPMQSRDAARGLSDRLRSRGIMSTRIVTDQ